MVRIIAFEKIDFYVQQMLSTIYNQICSAILQTVDKHSSISLLIDLLLTYKSNSQQWYPFISMHDPLIILISSIGHFSYSHFQNIPVSTYTCL